MPDPATIQLIFTRAIRTKVDSATVRVRPEQLVSALGQSTAEQLAGRPIDVAAIEAAAAQARQQQLDRLTKERDELKQLAVHDRDSRRALQTINQTIAKVQKGQLNAHALVAVNVGALKAALAVESAAPSPETGVDPQSEPEADETSETAAF